MALSQSFLRQRQSLSLESKVNRSKRMIREYYEKLDGKVYVAFSGGKDSTVLLHLVRSVYPDIPAVFCDTGLEYPEIKKFVKATANVTTIRPKMNFKDVIEKYGYPVVSKKVARMIRDLQNPTVGNQSIRRTYLTGLKKNGDFSDDFILPEKWKYLINAPFKVSERCCDIMKKNPFKTYQKETGRFPYIGVMACDSKQRQASYLQTGCNSYSKSKTQSKPIAFWLREDVEDYIKINNLKYSKIYDMGENHTGCIFCMFGVHLDPIPNRFQRLAISHPKQYTYCMETLELHKVLNCLDVPCRPDFITKNQQTLDAYCN